MSGHKFLIVSGICIVLSSIVNAIPIDIKSEHNETEEVNPEEIGGFFEGDMMLDEDQLEAIMNPRGRNIRVGDKYKWKNAVVYYQIDSAVFNTQQATLIRQAMDVIEQNAPCMVFKPRSKSSKDYIHIIGKPTGCHSRVGRSGGKQTLNLAPNSVGKGCFKLYTIVHELLHALGFHHQQSTYNRDDFVTIITKNIKDGHQKNFKKYSRSEVYDFFIPYDYESVMHYGSTSFSKNGQPTIIPIDRTVKIGQRSKLSKKDIEKLNRLYCLA